MSKLSKTNRSELKRVSKRGHYDQETIYPILDSGYVCHVGFNADQQPFVIPMAYGRQGNRLFLHGSSKSRLQNILSDSNKCCITVTLLDGLVISRSAFDHSMNYRSVVVFGKAVLIEDQNEKLEALKHISDHLIPNRWKEVRKPNKKELKATSVLAVEIEEATAKIRSGPPKDNRKDLALSVWAGIIPFEMSTRDPVADPLLNEKINIDESVVNFKIKL